MKAVVNRIIENNLIELKGLSIEGEIPITEEFLNDLIGVFMESSSSQTTGEERSLQSSAGSINFSQIINALDKKELKIELKEKLAVLKINAKKF